MEHNDMCLRIFPSSQFSLFCLIPPELLTGQTSWLLLAADTTTHTYFPIRWILLQTSGESQSSACKNSLHNDFDEVCVTVWCVMWHRGMWVWHRVTESVTGMLWLWSHRTHLTKQLSYKELIDVQNSLRCKRVIYLTRCFLFIYLKRNLNVRNLWTIWKEQWLWVNFGPQLPVWCFVPCFIVSS